MPTKTQSIVGGELYPARVLRDTPVAYYRLGDVEGYAQAVVSDAPAGYWRLGESEGYAQAVLSDGPVGYWRLGANANDSSGAGRNGTAAGGVTFGQAGPLADGSTAALFNGSSGVVSTAGNAAFSANAMSVACWFNAQTLPGGRTELVEIAIGGVRVLELQHVGNVLNPVCYYADATNSDLAVGLKYTGLVTGTWYHVAATHDGTTTRLYLNGAQVGTFAKAANLKAVTSPAVFMGALEGPSQFANDLIEEVAVYGYALTAAQVANHYALRTSTIATVTAVTLADSSGNGNTLTAGQGVATSQAGALQDANTAVAVDGTASMATASGRTIGNFGTANFAVEAWVNQDPPPYLTDSANPQRIVMGRVGGTGGNGWRLWYHPNSILMELFKTSTGLWYTLAWSHSIPVVYQTWKHVVVTVDRTANTATCYVNGVNLGAQTWNAAVVGVAIDANTGTVLTIGNSTFAPASKFQGKIDEVALYTYALSAAQVANHYALRTSTIATTAAATVADASGNARTGTIVGGVTLQQTGALADGNQAARFDAVGTTAINTFNDFATIVPNTAWSLECWVNTTYLGGDQALITRNNVRPSVNISGAGGGDPYVNTFDGTTNVVVPAVGVNVCDGQWHHVVATYDGTNVRIYSDGVLKGGPTAAGNYQPQASAPWRIGARTDLSFPLNGAVDEVALYAYALTDEQIAAHYFNRLTVPSGLRASGAAPFAFKRAIVGAGGVGVSGTATWRRGRVRLGSGGLRIGGVSPTAHAKAFHPVYAARVVDVVDESRTVVVPAESRIVVVPFESRVDAVPAEV
jgi:hypothetical protein